MEPGALGGELHEHGDPTVGLRSRRGEEALGHLPLDHHAPAFDEADRPGSRRRSGWRRCTAGSRRACAAAGERPEVEPRARRRARPDVREVRQVREERVIDLDGVDERHARRQVPREHAEPGTDLQHDVGRRRAARRPITPRMFPSTRKCWPSSLRGLTLFRAGRSCGRVLFDPRLERSRLLPAGPASAARVWTTFAGSFCRPRTGCGARYGTSVSARIRSAGIAGGCRRAGRSPSGR